MTSSPEDGLPLAEFVNTMLECVPMDNEGVPENEVIAELTELFRQVDVNGDGTMEWEEFTGFCIEQGMAATQHDAVVLDELYFENLKYKDTTTTYSKVVERFFWFPLLNKLFACEAGNPRMKVYCPSRGPNGPVLLHEISMEDALSKGRDMIEAGSVTAVEVITPHNLLVTATTDLALVFWDMSAYRRDPDGATPWFKKRIYTPKPQTNLAWCETESLLFTAGAGKAITGWRLSFEGHGAELTLTRALKMNGHTDVVMDMLYIKKEFQVLATCGMDKRILLWNVEKGIVRGKRMGHKGGVRMLARGGRTNTGSSTILSSGFDYEVFVWDVKGLSKKPLMVLRGHRFPVLRVQFCRGRAITIDERGMMKWWNLSDDMEHGADRCLQTFTTERSSDMRPTTMIVCEPFPRIIVGSNKMRVFDSRRIRPKELPCCNILYNDTSMSIIAAADRSVRVWDVRTGEILSRFFDAAPTEISKLVLDDRERKFIVSDVKGGVTICNYMNGACMKKAEDIHSKQISDMIYCKEDRCIITVGWDQRICVLDEEPGDEIVPVLRSVEWAHTSDITCAAHSFALSLIATADSSGNIKLWDFQFLSFEGSLPVVNSGIEITCMAFADPYPFLVVADFAGDITCFSVRPWHPVHRVICSPSKNIIVDKFQQATEWPIVAMSLQYDPDGGEEIVEGVRSGKFVLFCGDENGNLSKWDLSKLIRETGASAIEERQMPCQKNNYNARRRLQLWGEGYTQPKLAKAAEERKSITTPLEVSIDGDNKLPALPQAVQIASCAGPERVQVWHAHVGSITSISVSLPNGRGRPGLVLSSGEDKAVRLWTLDGEPKGILTRGEAIDSIRRNPYPWNSLVDEHQRHFDRLQEANMTLVEVQKLHAENVQAVQDAQSAQLAEPSFLEKAKLRRKSLMQTNGKCQEKGDAEGGHIGEEEEEEEEEAASAAATTTTTTTKQKASDNERSRLLKQMLGGKTWDLSPAELGHILSMEKEKEARNEAAREVTETLSSQQREDAAMQELLSDPPSLQHLKDVDPPSLGGGLPPHHPDNWAINSHNRQRMLYPSFFGVHEHKLAKATRVSPKHSGITDASDFMKEQFEVHSQVVKEYESGKARHNERVAASIEAMKKRQQEQMLEEQTRRSRDSKMKRSRKPKIPTARMLRKQRRAIAKGPGLIDELKVIEASPPQRLARMNPKRLQEMIDRYDSDVKDALTPQGGRRNGKGKKKSKKKRGEQSAERRKQLRRKLHFGTYRKEHVIHMRHKFKEMDKDGSGSVELDEFLESQKSSHIGDHMTGMFRAMDKDKDGTVDIAEMCSVVFHKAPPRELRDIIDFMRLEKTPRVVRQEPKGMSEEEIAELANIFDVYDTDNSRSLSRVEIFKSLGVIHGYSAQTGLSVHEINDLVDGADEDGNGEIDKEEFITMMRHVFEENPHQDTTFETW